MIPGPLLILLVLSCVCGTVVSERELVYVTVLFRHGDRSPVHSYPTDPYQESAWPQGFGQLSQIGMEQHYKLGQFLRHRYTGFLKESYDRHEILVRSTDYDRTLMSAEANLAGLYPPNGSQVFNPDIKWQPVPVHTVPMSEERLLSFPLNDCPRYKLLMNETEQTEEFLNTTALYEDVIELVRNKTLLNKTDIESVWAVYDTLFCEAQHNMTPPVWVTPEVMAKLKYLKDFAFRTIFGLYKQTEKSRLQGGMLLGEIVKNLTRIAAEDPKPQLKFMMLSAHDTTVAALQASLNVFNFIQPPYASCHIFELNKEDNGTELYQLQLPGCALYCPLEEFKALTKPSISDDRDKECQLPSEGTKKEVIISLAVSGCLLFLLIAILLAVICRQTEPMRSRGYHHVINEAES
ncbi:lysosomal acid phosphatase isoform X1 [Boleophthalmus pectinirostris]|uniref:lysosomal acid phosphatase isoform X1 n=1 Tax=Boleophthalmus pectinirostris TaxID=150288 RepID=UPI00242EFAC1|nr:lysosomal acid phosphatase isoform X1 [Boleophthalmus pectinirostris]